MMLITAKVVMYSLLVLLWIEGLLGLMHRRTKVLLGLSSDERGESRYRGEEPLI